MITPRFELSQDDDFVILAMLCPLIKGENMEFSIEENKFTFSCQPYFLRLRFPGTIVEDGREKCEWLIDEGKVKIWIPKETKGEYFYDLDMVSKLLATRNQQSSLKNGAPLIQELDNGLCDLNSERNDENELSIVTTSSKAFQNMQDGSLESSADKFHNVPDFDWEVEQTYPQISLSVKAKYGFDLNYSDALMYLSEEKHYELFGCHLDDSKATHIAYQQKRRHNEFEKFSIEHYLYDLADEDGSIAAILAKQFWFSPSQSLDSQLSTLLKVSDDISTVVYTEREQEELVGLKIKQEYFLSNKPVVFCGLLELLLAYCYASKTFDEDYTNSEFSWNIAQLSPMMQYLEPTQEISTVFDNFMIRSLTYPLYRNWKLSYSCLLDALNILKMGKGFVLKALICLRIAFRRSEGGDFFTRIFLNDYCGWIQSDTYDSKEMQLFAQKVKDTISSVTKASFSFISLIEIEMLLTADD